MTWRDIKAAEEGGGEEVDPAEVGGRDLCVVSGL